MSVAAGEMLPALLLFPAPTEKERSTSGLKIILMLLHYKKY
jgi:hypothetical protein